MEQQHDPSRELATSAPKSDGEIEAIKRYLGWIGVLLQTHFDQFTSLVRCGHRASSLGCPNS
jgi:hypothetical protein